MSVQEAVYLDTKRELAKLLKEKERRLGMTDLHYMCTNILGYKDLTIKEGFHGELCSHLQNPKSKFKLTLTPRGSLKSSVGIIGQSIQDIVKNPNVRILLASEKFKLATMLLAELKGHLEKNKKFISLYGDLVSDATWTQSEIIVKTRNMTRASPTIACAGIDVIKVGTHYDIIRVDDCHSPKNTTNQDQINKVITWYKLLFSLLDPGGYLYIMGTIWHYNDLYNYIINKEQERAEKGLKKRFSVFIRDSFKGTNEDLMEDRVEDKDLLWPERLSADFLRDTLVEQGPYIFSCQYRLNPIDDETAVFKRSWITTCEPEDVPKNLSVFSTVDPMGINQDGNDYLAITTIGMDEKWRGYILDVRRLKADEHDTVDEIYDVYKTWKPEKIGFESVSFQNTYYKYIQLLRAMKGIHFPISQLKTSNKISKKMRIKSMVPYWKAGLYIIPVAGGLDRVKGTMKILVDELTRYPKVSNDDTVDALAYINQLTHRPNIVSILKAINPKSFKAIQLKNRKNKREVLGARNVRERKYA